MQNTASTVITNKGRVILCIEQNLLFFPLLLWYKLLPEFDIVDDANQVSFKTLQQSPFVKTLILLPNI